jgi:hypothetical protein
MNTAHVRRSTTLVHRDPKSKFLQGARNVSLGYDANQATHKGHIPRRRAMDLVHDLRRKLKALEASLVAIPAAVGVAPKAKLMISGHGGQNLRC